MHGDHEYVIEALCGVGDVRNGISPWSERLLKLLEHHPMNSRTFKLFEHVLTTRGVPESFEEGLVLNVGLSILNLQLVAHVEYVKCFFIAPGGLPGTH